MPPRQVGPYEILSLIGRGGIGTVYRGRHHKSGRLVAVKVLGPSPAVDARSARRLAKEYEVLSSLDHPNVVRVFDAGAVEGYSYLAMELVVGLDLRAYLSPELAGWAKSYQAPPSLGDYGERPSEGADGVEAIRRLASMMDEPETEPERWPGASRLAAEEPEGPIPPPTPEALVALNRPERVSRLRSALAQVADALSYVHHRGLVHRDLKPSNIMVDDSGRARLMDFGLVKGAAELDDGLTQTGRIVGTYRYMSPEQAQARPVDFRSDLFSLGVILYEFLSGVPPCPARDPAVLWSEILHGEPAPVASINPSAATDLSALAMKLLAKDPASRPSDAAAVSRALRSENSSVGPLV